MRRKVKGKLYFLARDAKSRMRNYNKEKSIFEQVVINPIQELVDRKYYNTLSLEAKQKYIFELSEKYKEMKNRYEIEHQRFAQVSNI